MLSVSTTFEPANSFVLDELGLPGAVDTEVQEFPLIGENMSDLGITENGLKQALKDALVEVLEERRDFLRDVIEEVLEDFEMIEDYQEVRKAERRSSRSVFGMREGEA